MQRLSTSAWPIKFIFAAFVVFVVSYFGYVAFQKQFQLKNISLNEELSSSIDGDIPISLDGIINQPFSYLDRGRQSFAFVSGDGRYVLKFFDTRCLRNDLLPYFGAISKKKCLKKISRLIAGYSLASQEDRKYSGLIYFQPKSNERLADKVVHLADRFGISHAIDLGSVPFVVQYKAIPTREIITQLLEKGDVDGVKNRLKQIISMYMDEYQRGIYDRDHNFMYNTGFLGNEVMRIDVGRLRSVEQIKDPQVYRRDLQILSRRTDEWLGRHFPQYRNAIMAYMQSYLSGEEK